MITKSIKQNCVGKDITEVLSFLKANGLRAGELDANSGTQICSLKVILVIENGNVVDVTYG